MSSTSKERSVLGMTREEFFQYFRSLTEEQRQKLEQLVQKFTDQNEASQQKEGESPTD